MLDSHCSVRLTTYHLYFVYFTCQVTGLDSCLNELVGYFQLDEHLNSTNTFRHGFNRDVDRGTFIAI